jgi:hypothetical protein
VSRSYGPSCGRVYDRHYCSVVRCLDHMQRSSRQDSDEGYLVNLCDAVLGEAARRQHRFDWLRGDPGRDGRRRTLPVDAYYVGHRLVVEYRERQHDEPVAHCDKPDRLTVSGVHRGIQRRIYDDRRAVEVPAHGLRLIVLRPNDLATDKRGRLLRDRASDLAALRVLLFGEPHSDTA